MTDFIGSNQGEILPTLILAPLTALGNDRIYGLGGDDILLGWTGDDLLEGGQGADILIGGILNLVLNLQVASVSGNDTASYATSAAAVQVNLQDIVTIQISLLGLDLSLTDATRGHGGDAEGDYLAGIRNLIGSAHDDTLGVTFGDIDAGGGNDRLVSGLGANTLDGNSGIDTVDYSQSTAGVTVDLALTTAQVSAGYASGDILRGIENLVGSAHADQITGDAGVNIITGNGGNDVIDGGAGEDTAVFAGTWANYTISQSGSDILVHDPAANETTTLRNIENIRLGGTTYSAQTVINVAPIFANASIVASPLENIGDTTIIAAAAASDGNVALGDSLTYSIFQGGSGIFEIDAATGAISLVAGQSLDAETAQQYVLTIRATDSKGLFGNATVTINVGDIDEFDVTAPVDGNAAANRVAENAAVGTLVGITAFALDADRTTNAIAYSLVNPTGEFAIDVNSGVVTVAGAIDYEAGATRTITLRATSADGSFQNSDFTVDITNVNEPPTPPPSGPTVAVELGATAAPLGLVDANLLADPEGDPLFYTVSALPTAGSVSLNGAALAIGQQLTAAQVKALAYTAPLTDSHVGPETYHLDFSVGDGSSAPVSFSVNLSVTDAVNGIYTGDAGANRIDGAAGNDVVNGLGGNDTLIGGIGNDHFVFRPGYGADTILDFAHGDTINMRGYSGISTFADVLAHATQVGADTVIDLGGGDMITLQNVLKTSLVAGDFSLGALDRPIDSLVAYGSSPVAGGWATNDRYPRLVGDVNGDGKADIVGFGELGTFVSLSKGDGSFTNPSLGIDSFGWTIQAGGWTTDDRYHREIGDVNGDGRADIVGFGDIGTWVSLSSGDGTFQNPILAINSFGYSTAGGGWSSDNIYARTVADVNGDGAADLVGFGAAGTFVALASGSGSFGPVQLAIDSFGTGVSAGGWTTNDKYPRTVADVNGDGRADIVGFGDAAVYVSLGKADGTFASPHVAINSFGYSPVGGGWTNQDAYPRQVFDVNDDGRADIVGFGSGGVYVSLGQSDGTFASPTFEAAAFGTASPDGGWTSQNLVPRQLGDINGDGSADIIGFSPDKVIVSLANDWIFT